MGDEHEHEHGTEPLAAAPPLPPQFPATFDYPGWDLVEDDPPPRLQLSGQPEPPDPSPRSGAPRSATGAAGDDDRAG